MSDYKPINCDLHSIYELAIMKGQPVMLRWALPSEPEVIYNKLLLLTDIKVKQHEEILVAELNTGNQIEIRLDYILSIKAQ